MNPPGRYTFRVFYERLGGTKKGWMQKDLSITTRKEWSDADIRQKMEDKAAEWSGTIEGSNPRFREMYGPIRRITVVSVD